MRDMIYATLVIAMLAHVLSALVVGYVELFRRPELWGSRFHFGGGTWLLLTLRRRQASARWIWALIIVSRIALLIALIALGALFLSLMVGTIEV
ncbi:hypothetical protein [uncultured Brevundimonas sp.]|uniref:hypothetical protein n=1 Tax=uncultured Brevundimonas sp. TaxID=213418 RepID=UPI0025990DA7|nr:hypothetical protein [uncultured Brevundimonas sp.]